MKTTLLCLLSSVLLISNAPCQSAVTAVQNAVSAEQWSLVQAALIEQRNAINAAHTATLAAQTASSQQQIEALNAELAKTQSDLSALQGKMQTQLNGDLKYLQETLKAATNDTQKAVLAGQIALIQGYLAAAFKSPDQLKVETLAAEIATKQAELAKLQADQAK